MVPDSGVNALEMNFQVCLYTCLISINHTGCNDDFSYYREYPSCVKLDYFESLFHSYI